MPEADNAPTSGEVINYNLRLAKHIERKMLCDAFARMGKFGLVSNYKYVGFGSFYFTDFSLFHKRLGISKMISIERKISLEKRCRHNKPFKCIKLAMAESSTALEAALKGSERTILWLDYDKKLDRPKLDDIGTACATLVPGSIILVSVNAQPGRDEGRVDRLREALPEDMVPENLTSADLAKWKTASFYRRIIDQTIAHHLSARNIELRDQQKLQYEQIFNFHYKDGAEMVTVGGVIFRADQRRLFNECNFNNLAFYRHEANDFLIEVPQLTYRELRYLDSNMPFRISANTSKQGIPDDDIGKYADLYRYFPTYADTDL